MLEHDCQLSNPNHSKYDADGRTPIICKLINAPDTETIAVFCELAPTSICVRSQEEGLTCLHYVCEWVSFINNIGDAAQAVKILLQVDPTQATAMCDKTSFSRTSPLDAVWGWWSDATPETREIIIELTKIILDTVVPELDGGNMLHQLMSFPCPLPVMAVRQFSQSVTLDQLDDRGNSVIHRAISNNQDPGIIVQLLYRNKALVRQQNNDGKLPIQLAQRWTLAHDQLLFYDPGMVETIALPESLYPLLLSQLKSVEALFQIIQAKPTLVQRWEMRLSD